MGKEFVMMDVKLPIGTSYVRTEVTEQGFKIICKNTNAKKSSSDDNALNQKESLIELFKWIDVDEIKKYDFGEKRKNKYEEILRNNIINASRKYPLKGFFAPKYEPSINEEGKVQYVAGATPAIGKSALWWNEQADKFWKARKSGLGTDEEYYLTIGYLIKKGLLSWQQAAINSSTAGNYMDSPKSSEMLEKTGTRKCGFFYGFIGNTCKYIKIRKTSGYGHVGGKWEDEGKYITACELLPNNFPEIVWPYCVGWIVLRK